MTMTMRLSGKRSAATTKPRPHTSLVGRAGRAVLWVWIVASLVPLLFIVVTAFKPENIAKSIPPRWLFHPTLGNFKHVLVGGDGLSQGFDELLTHSLIVTAASTILSVAVSVPAAYAMSLKGFRPRKALSSWVLSTYMFPPIVAVIPVFIFAGNLNLIDTYWVLIVPYAAFNLPISVWILRAAILQIPYEVQESAMVDGANRWVILRRIVGPLLGPTIATAAILSAILSWNEYLFALSLTRTAAKTAPVGEQEFTGMFGTQWGSLTAGAAVIIAPILIMTLVLRRRIVSGLTLGAVK
jgi:ABC-type glycerol-3-phosphate transport system permease component